MRRLILAMLVLGIGLGAGLWWRLQDRAQAALGPPRGSGTVEGIEIGVVAQIGARIRRIHVQEGDRVRAGQVLVVLDCRRSTTVLDEARARVLQAESGRRSAQAAVRGARAESAAQASAAGAAAHLAQAATSDVTSAKSAEVALGAERRALDVEWSAARLAARRARRLLKQQFTTQAALEAAASRAGALRHRLGALSAQAEAARAKRRSVRGQAAAAAMQARVARARSATSRALVVGAGATALAAAHAAEAAKAALRRSELDVAECDLRAPRDAVVTSRNFEPGEVVQPGARVLTLQDLSEARVIFFVANAELARVAPGMEVRVVADALPDRAFRGRISYVSAAAEFTPRNIMTRKDRDRLVYAARATIPNQKGWLRAGMPVEVQVVATAPGTQTAATRRQKPGASAASTHGPRSPTTGAAR